MHVIITISRKLEKYWSFKKQKWVVKGLNYHAKFLSNKKKKKLNTSQPSNPWLAHEFFKRLILVNDKINGLVNYFNTFILSCYINQKRLESIGIVVIWKNWEGIELGKFLC